MKLQSPGEAEALPGQQRLRMNALEEQEEQFHFHHITPSWEGAHCHTEKTPLGLCFSSEKKRIQGGYPASPALWDASWQAHLGPTSQGSPGESAELNYWDSDRGR